MEIKGCIFDLDGVIVDTAKYHYQSWKRLAKELGFEFDVSVNEQLKGISRMDSLNIVLGQGNIIVTEEEKEDMCFQKNEWYKESIAGLDESELLPGVKSFIQKLRAQNIKIGLGSASRNAKTILKAIGIDSLFDVMIDGNDVTKSKPDPEVFVKGAEGLALDPKNVVVFEDARKGLEAAITAGFIPVGVGTPELLPEADFHIQSFEAFDLDQLIRHLDNVQ